MVFSDKIFLFAFLPACLILFLIFGRNQLKKVFLVLFFSLSFYYYAQGLLLLLLVFVALVSWFSGLLLQKDRSKAVVAVSIILQMASLIYFKYALFFSSFLNPVLSDQAYNFLENIVLPVGISFFTFQGVSYVIDVYREEIEPERSFLTYLSYLSFFPQLIAGPIVRYADVKSQFNHLGFRKALFVAGIIRFSHGLFKKLIIADSAGLVADTFYSIPTQDITFLSAIIGTTAYTIQIYFDFSGYSDMAIGLGLMFGVRFKENFNLPYSASTITDFWRRWHISLSNWFRDYLYIPLGGNRNGPYNTYRNLAIIFLTTGLWHGAAWVFIFWGIYHGAFIVIERIGKFGHIKDPKRATLLRIFYAFPVVSMGWVLFRAESIGQALGIYKSIFTPFSTTAMVLPDDLKLILSPAILLAFTVGILLSFRPRQTKPFGVILEYWFSSKTSGWLRPFITTTYVTLGLIISGIVALTATFSPFLYFRF